MSEFHVEVVRVGPVTKHPNADTLSITNIHGGYPVIMRTGEYVEGDLAVYVPVDALVPADDPRWEFLGVNTRIKAKRLRGVFSMGLLTKADPSWTLGQDVREALRITKWEADAPEEGSADEADPGTMPVYTDIEGLRRHRHALVEGEEVILTEKIHGENFRAMHDGERLWVGSRTRVKKRDPKASNWWRAAIAAGLEDTLRAFPGVIIYGESCGYTGGFPYRQAGRVPTLRVFDAMDSRSRRYFDADDFYALASGLRLTVAPPLYRGPWSWDLVSHADGMSVVDPTHIREGFVVRPVKERVDERLGRVILKMHGEAFLTRGKAGG